MKLKLSAGLTLLTLLLGGCVVQTIHPLFEEPDYVEYPALVGSWRQQEDGKDVGLWVFSKQDQRYKLIHTDENKRKANFLVTAGKIGTNVFLDLVVDDPLPGSELNGVALAGLIPVHLFAKVVKTNDTLVFLAMDYEWFEKLLKENPSSIAHIMQDNRPIVTASKRELQAFVAKYANDNKIFKNEIRLKKSQAN